MIQKSPFKFLCLTIEELKTFLEERDERKVFFTDKNEWQKIASQRLLSENSSLSSIVCKIVKNH
jgi:hypothetical protein